MLLNGGFYVPFAVDFGSGPEAREEGHANALTRRCFLLWLLLTTDGRSVSVLTLHEFCKGSVRHYRQANRFFSTWSIQIFFLDLTRFLPGTHLIQFWANKIHDFRNIFLNNCILIFDAEQFYLKVSSRIRKLHQTLNPNPRKNPNPKQ